MLSLISKDKIPFPMHDKGEKFLQKTTDVDVVFSNQTFNNSSDITMKELLNLNAGEWFVKVTVGIFLLLVTLSFEN